MRHPRRVKSGGRGAYPKLSTPQNIAVNLDMEEMRSHDAPDGQFFMREPVILTQKILSNIFNLVQR